MIYAWPLAACGIQVVSCLAVWRFLKRLRCSLADEVKQLHAGVAYSLAGIGDDVRRLRAEVVANNEWVLALTQPWQQADFKDLRADLCCFKNTESILQQIPHTMEGADVHVLEFRGVWITELQGADTWFELRCTSCRKTQGCSCGVEMKPGCFGVLQVTDATGSVRAAVGDIDDVSVVQEVLCVKNLQRLPRICDGEPGALLLKNRLNLRLRVAPCNADAKGYKMGARIVCANSDLYKSSDLAGDFGQPLHCKSDASSINELFYEDLMSIGGTVGRFCEVGICLATTVTDATFTMDCHYMTGHAMVLDVKGDSKQAKIFGFDRTEAGAARFALVRGKAYILLISGAGITDGMPTLTLQRGLLIKEEDLGVVTKNFSSAAQHTRAIFALQGSDTPAPTSFAELVKCGAKAGVKRKYVDKFASPEKVHDDALSPFLTHGTVQAQKSKTN